MNKVLKTLKKSGETGVGRKISVLAFSGQVQGTEEFRIQGYEVDLKRISRFSCQREYEELLEACSGDIVVMVNTDRMGLQALPALINRYEQQGKEKEVFYCVAGDIRGWKKRIPSFWRWSRVSVSPVYIGRKELFQKAYAASDLCEDALTAIGYSLQKNYVRFRKFEGTGPVMKTSCVSRKLGWNYTFKLPALYLLSGNFFREFFRKNAGVQRNMVYRLFFVLFAVFTFLYMPFISRDYGVTGDEFPDHRHTAYVLDYFAKGDKTALNQPQTTLHLYGISMQVVAGAISRWFHIDHYYEARHVICALNGALSILFAGLAGLRWGGGLCGFLSLLLMFFTPRFFGHSMNNLKDIPFAAGYIVALYYTVRLFDTWPVFRIRYMAGLILGIALALGTRSGGLILYPMLFMYAGFFYIGRFGIKEFYKFGKYRRPATAILVTLVVIVFAGYFLAIALWPFALQKPFSNVLFSLQQFTNYSIGLKTIFDGEQMMSNMLPWKYAPKYLLIAMPVVTLAGFFGYLLYVVFRRKEFTLISYFFLFATVFPVFWVIYKNSNLYGGIRHLLFVMPPMVVIAARFWQLSVERLPEKWGKIGVILCFIAGLSLPVKHMIKNHPNDYIYFNELAGGLKRAYGNYETDYYYNSLKAAYSWFRKNVDLPKDRKTIVATNHSGILEYYFRADTNVKVIYTRYYEKYAKDWDYALFANVYINRYQLKQGLFPPEGTIYTPTVDGYPMTAVICRQGKEELEGYRLEAARRYAEALDIFKKYIEKHSGNEEVMSRIAKISYLTGNLQDAEEYGKRALSLQPSLNEALYILTLTYTQQNKLKEAMRSAQAIIDENAFSADGLYLKALVFDKMKNYQEAIRSINKALSIRPGHVGSLILGGDILFRFGNYQSAVDIYNRLLKVKGDWNDLVRLADCYCRLKQYGQMEEALKRAEEIQPGTLQTLKVRLRRAIQQGDRKTAEAVVNYTGKVKNDAGLYILRGLYEDETGRRGEALGFIEEALRLEPDNFEALELKKKWRVEISGKS